MRKYAILMVLTAFIVAFTSGCGLIVKDEAVDAQTVIIEVAGQTYVKSEVQQATENILDYQEYIYSLYGMGYDRTDADHIAAAKESAISALIEEAVTKQKAQEYGVDQFTDEELVDLMASVDETYDSYASYITTSYFADTELTGDELDAAVEAKMLELGYGSKDEMLEQEKQSAAIDKLKDYVVKDVAVTDDEIQSAYDTNVANAISAYASTLTQYASDVTSGSIIYDVPAGYRYVKNLLIKLSDEDSTAIQTLTTDISDKQSSLDSTISAIADLPEDATTDTEDQAKSREELTALSESLTTEIADLQAQLEMATENAYAAIQPTVDEVVAKLAAGESFDALLETYGQDSGMTVEPAKTTGYLVCEGLTTYVNEFITAAMALKNVGDVSDPFRTDYGIHIVQYTSDVEDGVVALADVTDPLKAELLTDKQNTFYDDTVSQWVTDAKAKTYADRLDN